MKRLHLLGERALSYGLSPSASSSCGRLWLSASLCSLLLTSCASSSNVRSADTVNSPKAKDKVARRPAPATPDAEEITFGADKPAPVPKTPPPVPEDDSLVPVESTGELKRKRTTEPSRPGVKAGAADDNLQFNAFVQFLRENGRLGLPFDVEDRVVLQVNDREGRPLSGAKVRVNGDVRRTTYADGQTLLHLRRWGVSSEAKIVIEGEQGVRAEVAGAQIGRRAEVTLPVRRATLPAVPLDVAFVLDTTGSMGDELDKLRATLDTIVFQISQMQPRPQLRLGMVLFRDRGDDYVTRKVPFTSNINQFKKALSKVKAGGGGDTPEDVQSGLKVALHDLAWGRQGLKLAFLVGDAPPHLDYSNQKFTYVEALEEAAERGIKIATIGASGLDLRGEVVWRQIAQATMSPFVFLTYGETGDADGTPSTVSHHVGSNWEAADLDAIIVRLVKLELAHFSEREVRPQEDWFTADSTPDRPRDDVLEELFDASMKQLVSYAVEPIEARTPTVLLPLSVNVPRGDSARGRLERGLALGLGRKSEFQLLETESKAVLLRALADQMTLAYNEEKIAEAGKLVPAKLAVLGQLGQGAPGRLELLLKLIRLETGEVLSLSLLKIDEQLIL